MNNSKLAIALLMSSVLLTGIANAKSPQLDLSESNAVVNQDLSAINVSAPDSVRFLEMSLQISTEAGEVIFEERSKSDALVFNVDASMPDGEYWYTVKTVVVLSAAEQAATPSNPEYIVSTQKSRFYVLGGYKVSENDYLEQVVRNPQASNEKVSSSLMLSLAETVLNFFVASAQAADLTVADGTPQIFLDDTGTTDSDWEIFGNAGGDVGFYRLRNNLGDGLSSNIFGIDGSTTGNGGMTLLIQEDGDVEFGVSRAAFLSSTSEPMLVIGDVNPSLATVVNLELKDDIPYLLFRDTDTDANAGLFNNGSAFILEGNDLWQNIFTFDLLAPANSLYVNSIGNVGFGTATPNSAVDVQRSAAAASFQLTSFTDTANQAPQFIQRRSRGSSGAPLAVGLNDNLGLISFRGYTGSGFTGTKATLAAQATENWSPTANGTRLIFGTTENGTTGLNAVLEITHDGKVKINGTTLTVPDYVFEEDYDLMSLDELSAFIKENKHLPGVAAASEVNADGLDIAGSQLSVLEKVEELTLYTIQQHEQLTQLKAENIALQEKVAKVDQLEQMVSLLMQRFENDKLLTTINQ